jgi:hypothetical protein
MIQQKLDNAAQKRDHILEQVKSVAHLSAEKKKPFHNEHEEQPLPAPSEHKVI